MNEKIKIVGFIPAHLASVRFKKDSASNFGPMIDMLEEDL